MSSLSEITKFFTSDPEELIALKRRVMGDVMPIGHVDAIYCVGGTVDTQDQALSIAALYWQHRKKTAQVFGSIDTIGVLRGSTKYGYCGFEFCRDRLIGHGVDEEVIIPVDILPQDRDRLDTYTEAKALVYHARINGWKKIILCAPFFHQIRASSTLISFLDRENLELWVFNLPGHPAWMGRVKHSQGVVEGDLFDLLIEEFGRLFRYYDKGDIRSCAELLAYYDRRDKEFLELMVMSYIAMCFL